MKALELTVYPRIPRHCHCCSPGYEGPHEPVSLHVVDAKVRAKRFSDPELASEYYKAATDFYSANSMHMTFEDSDTEEALRDARDWMFAMERFALAPHSSENGYQ